MVVVHKTNKDGVPYVNGVAYIETLHGGYFVSSEEAKVIEEKLAKEEKLKSNLKKLTSQFPSEAVKLIHKCIRKVELQNKQLTTFKILDELLKAGFEIKKK